MENNEFIISHLSSIGEDYYTMKPFMKSWLEKVTNAMLETHQRQLDAEAELKSIDYSCKGIASSLGISRTTLYNHGQLLKRYIEHVSASFTLSNPYYKLNSVASEKSLLQDKLTLMMERDIDNELLKAENEQLKRELSSKDAELQKLRGNQKASKVVPIA